MMKKMKKMGAEMMKMGMAMKKMDAKMTGSKMIGKPRAMPMGGGSAKGIQKGVKKGGY